MPGIGIITNANSRRNRRDPGQVQRLGYIVGDQDHMALTRRVDDIGDVARRFLDREIDILALNGGDGTNHVTLTQFIEAWGDHPLPRIALLRGGTMNTVSNSLGIRGNPGSILLALSEKYYTGQPFETTRRPLLCVDDGTGPNYGFIFGNGLVFNFLDEYYRAGEVSPVVAFRTLARAVGSAAVNGKLARRLVRRFRARIAADGEPWAEGEFTGVLASTTEQIGLGFRPFIRCAEKRRAFHCLAVTGDISNVVSALPAIRLGRPLDRAGWRDVVASELLFSCDEPLEYTIDGDTYRAQGPVRVSVGPELEILIK